VEVTPIVAAGRQVIEAYRPGHFRISGVDHATSVIVTPERTLAWDRDDIAGLTTDDFAVIVAADPPVDVLLVGCGRNLVPLPKIIQEGLRQAGIGADVMDTGAACRTYNVLVSENRRVAAALIAL